MQHMLASLNESGKMLIVLDTGAVSRGAVSRRNGDALGRLSPAPEQRNLFCSKQVEGCASGLCGRS
jgi:hypothetical protein